MEATVKLPGAKIVLECIKREGVDIIFGLPGGAVLPIYDALYDFEGLRHILVRQEAAAGHAAEGYARATGKVGVCLVTSGPACTNLVTALQDAMMDSIPIVAFTGQVPTHLIGNDACELAELTQIPVTTPLMWLGAFPSEHPLSIEMLGMHGTYYANMAVHHSDVLVAVGARFDDRVTGRVDAFAPHAEIIHIDIDPSSISKNIKVDVPIVGDCRRVLRALVEAVREEAKAGGDGQEGQKPWHAQIAEWKVKEPLRYEWSDDVIKPQYVIQEISNATRGEAMIVTGVGQHQMWAAQYYKFTHPRAWFTSGGLGTMGYGLPAAMGVQAAHPGRHVVNIDGDSSFAMNSQELATCFVEKLPVKTVIINNSGHGMVRQWQRIIYKERYCAIDLPGIPDWVKLAEAYGCVGLRVTKPAEVLPAIEKMLSTPAPVVLDVCVDKDECVFPMVPAGGANTDMILAPPTREVRDRAEKSQTGF